MDFTYHFLTHPLPQDFLDWYPFDKPENFHGASDLAWLQGMQKVTGDRLPGLRHTFVVAKVGAEYAGVCWLCESDATPDLAHFGWFLMVDEHQGKGAGRAILDQTMEYVDSRGIEMTMLPTHTTTEFARAMYRRRGFRDFFVEAGGTACWMVRAPEGHYEAYFTASADLACGDFEASDYIALDYLLHGAQWYPRRGQTQSRLYPLGLFGGVRMVSFKQTWEGCRLFAARRDGRLMAVAVVKDGEFDFYSHDPAASAALVEHVLRHTPRPLKCPVALSDIWKRLLVEDAGLKPRSTHEAQGPGGQHIPFDVYWAT